MGRAQKITYLFLFIMLVATGLFAAPNRTTYQARIVKPDGYPLEANNVTFSFTILDPTGTCELYVESYSAVNMTNSGGLISFSLGSGTRTFPTSATPISQVFDNSTVSYSCRAPGIYSPVSTDIRKIVMQFNDGTGWQTLPAMSINAVPYAMYANNSESLNGKADTAFVQYSTLPTCGTSQSLNFNGATFSCVAAGVSTTVTAGDITTALGYTPVNPATVNTSFTTVTSTVNNLGTSVTAVTSTVTGLAASLAAITSSQWVTSGTAVYYNNGNVGIGTDTPLAKLHVADSVATNIILDGSTNTNGAPGYVARKSRGTAASPTAVLQDDYLGTFGARGYGSTGYSGATKGMIGIKALENWTDSAQGAAIVFETTGVSSTTRTEKMRIDGAGNFGVGTSAPTHRLEVHGSASIAAFNSSSSNHGYLGFFTDIANPMSRTAYIGYPTSGSRILNIYSQYTSGSVQLQNSQGFVRLDSAGRFGVNVSIPATALDVSGGVRIGTENATCAPALAGTLRYNATNIEYCNGTTWAAFGVAGSGITNINGSTSATQNFAVDTIGNAPAFTTANGVHTLSIPLASAGSVTGGLLSNADYTTFMNKITSSAASIAQVLGYTPASATALANYLTKASNLSDLASSATARTNLGVGYIGTLASVDLSSTDVSGTLAIARTPSYVGDVTKAAASNTLVLSNSGVSAGTYTKVTVDAKGRVTSSSALTSADVTTALGFTPGAAASGVTLLNGSASQTQTFAVGTTGTAPLFNTANGIHTLNIPLASAGSVTGGLLSNVDYTTFMNKITSSAASIAQVLGYTPASATALANYLVRANNLSDLASSATARTNLGVGYIGTLASVDLGSADVSGTLAIARTPAYAGDVTKAIASNTLVLSNTGVVAGTYNKVTVDAKGRVTSSSALSTSDVTTALGYTPASATASTQWNTSGTTINYMLGDVGVGTANPTSKLMVSGSLITQIDEGSLIDADGSGNAARNKGLQVTGYDSTSDQVGAEYVMMSPSSGTAYLAMGVRVAGPDKYAYLTSSYGSNSTPLYINATGSHVIIPSSNLGVGVTSPSARVHISQGSTSIAPLKLTSGALLTSPQSGTIEYDGTYFYLTDGAGTRKSIVTDTGGTYANVNNLSSTGNMTFTPSGSVVVSSTTASTNSQTGALVVKGGLGVAGTVNVGGGINASGAVHTSSFMSAASLMYVYATGASYTNATDAYAAGHRGFVADLGVNTSWDMLNLKNVSGTHFIVESGGYTGIGTNNPDRRLTIIGDGTNYGDDVLIEATNNDSAGTFPQVNLAKSRGTSSVRTHVLAGDTLGALAFRGQGTSTLGYGAIIRSIAENDYSAIQSADLRFQTTASGTTADRMIISSAGNVGIGTTSPTLKLEVVASNVASETTTYATMTIKDVEAHLDIISPSLGGWGSGVNLVESSQTTKLFQNAWNMYREASETGNSGLHFKYGTNKTAGNNTTKMFLSTNGDVGIATVAPVAPLDVKLGAVSGAAIAISEAATDGFMLGGQLQLNGAENRFYIGRTGYTIDSATFDNPAELLSIKASGQVGIGTSAPAAGLDINTTGGETLILRDNNNVHTDVAYASYLRSRDMSGTSVWYLGDGSSGANGTWLLNYQANPIHFATSGTTRMYVGGNGNVGINTTAPYAMLDVTSGAIRSTRTGYENVQYIEMYGGDNVDTSPAIRSMSDESNKKPIYLQSFHDGTGAAAGNLGFFFQVGSATAKTDIFTIRETGLVGVGTTQPSEKIHVDATTSGRIAISSGSIFSTSGYGVSLESDTDDGIGYLNIHTAALGANRAEFQFRGGHGAAETAATRSIMSIHANNGRVSIGNNVSATAQLHIGAAEAAAGTTGSVTRLAIQPYGHTGGPYSIVARDVAADAFLDFKYSASNIMTFENDGSIGMGVTDPTQKLHVSGNIQLDGDIYGGQYGGTRAIWRFSTTDPNFGIFYTEAAPDRISFSPQGGGSTTPTMAIVGSSVGIGTSSPAATLDVIGSARATGSVAAWSDQRAKKNIEVIPDSLNKILQLRGVAFDWRNDEFPEKKFKATRDIGVIAQEVEKVFPEVVYTAPDSYKSVGYSLLVAPLINAVKELYQKWTADSEVIHRKMSSLEEENKAMKKYLCEKDPQAPFCKP